MKLDVDRIQKTVDSMKDVDDSNCLAGRPLRNCGDCGAKPGELHDRGCDVERCLLCGGQAIGCNCVYEVNGMTGDLEEEHPDIYENGATDAMYAVYDKAVDALGGRLPWTGEWPGNAECREFGLWSRMGDRARAGRSAKETIRMPGKISTHSIAGAARLSGARRSGDG